MEKLFIAYYRVSTKAQGQSGLGLDAQRETVLNYIHHNGNKLIKEFTEIESGKNDHRPELLKAIDVAKKLNATIVISKIDRLSRNLTFISTLMDSKVKFLACDNPEATELTIHIFASIAQWERKRISERICEALQAKKRNEPDFKFGTNNLTNDGRSKGHESISKNARTDINIRHCFHFIKPLKDAGYTYQAIATMLNDEGYKTRLGCSFHASQVRSIMKRFES